MSFGAPGWLWGLLTLPVLALLFIRAETRAAQRLRDFVSPRLLPSLAGTVDRYRRALRFGLQLTALALGFAALAQPRWGYTWEEAKRKGLDLFIAIDTSRSMLANDTQPSRLGRVKLAAQDLINVLEGDRVGVIAFAGRAFVQAPLTIDYDAVVEAISDLDTRSIPEGGTNISEAIDIARQTYGKSALGNRALILFTDGEELDGEAIKAAKAAAVDGVRIFTIGVGTPEGSLIPLQEDGGGTSFVKDDKGQVVKSKLDQKRLREIAESTGGFYLHLENGPRTMQQLVASGLANLHASEIDARMSRRPIERYQWPLGASVVALSLAVLLRDRKRVRVRNQSLRSQRMALAAAMALLLLVSPAYSAVPGVDLYRQGKYSDAYSSFDNDLKAHPHAAVKDKMEFDAGAAAFKMGNYDKAIEAFSNALLSPDKSVQENSHFNAGRTLEERADMDKQEEDTLRDLTNAESHYEDTLKLNPHNEAAKANLEEVKKKIERLKDKRKQPTPTPPPQQQQQQKKEQDKNDQSQQQQSQSNQQDQNQNQPQQQQQESQSQNRSGGGRDQEKEQQEAKNDRQPSRQSSAGQSPSPSPGQAKDQSQDQTPNGRDDNAKPSPSPGDNQSASPSPSAGEGSESGEGSSPSPAPSASPPKKFAGDIKGTTGQSADKASDASAEAAESEQNQAGQMSERQAEALLRSMKDDEARVQLDEHRSVHRVYKDW
jgi:Ca-activated chloride channel family protein